MKLIPFFFSLLALSFNQPKFCQNASWNPNARTFANNNTIGSYPKDIFITTNNTIYVPNLSNGKIVVWSEGSTTPTRNISANLSNSYSLFVTTTGDIYINTYNSSGGISKLTLNSTIAVLSMNISQQCFDLFVDINNTLYCSISNLHQVIAKSLNNGSNAFSTVAGTGTAGNASNMLNVPRKIFVDINFDLYVADRANHRIQLFRSGQLNGTTVAGSGSSITTITLYNPTGIVLDADKYLFIVDQDNHRIVGSGPTGFRCLVGCSGSGAASNQLAYPRSLSFDSYGNMFVTDQFNHRIQKFILMTNLCSETTVAPTTTQILKKQTTSTKSVTSTKHETSTEYQTPTKKIASTEYQISTKQIASTIMTSTMMMTTSKPFLSNQSCYAPYVTLIPSTSTLLSPIQFRRSQDFYIVSIIELNCTDSLSIITQWTIKNCTSICSNPTQLDEKIKTILSELYIPARTLAYGIYELTLTVTMSNFSWLITSLSVYVEITVSGIIPNLVQLGTSMTTNGYEQDLLLDPGSFSVDPDENIFNSNNWKYSYYCRIYGLYNFPNFNGSLLTIENSTIDVHNPSCLLNRTDNKTGWKYGDSIKSSLTILSHSLQSNRTYQFMVYMENRRNSLLRATGFVLVKVKDTYSQLIAIGCVISTMCVPDLEFQLVNPTTQVALFSICIGNCTEIQSMTWNIYYGSFNSSLNFTTWILFNQTTLHQNIWFFGTNTSNFTATNKLFLSNSQMNLWRFEAVYSFISETSISALNFVINQPPYNGSCSINALNGTTSTLFTISSPDWFDQDGIKDYSLYTWTTEPSIKMMIAFSSISTFQVRLPAGDDQTSSLHLIVYIRDQLNCITECNMSSVTVVPDSAAINDLINSTQSSSNGITNNPIAQLLASGNQNTIGQVITSLLQQFNKMNSENLNKAVSCGIPVASISISPLGSQSSQGTSVPLNQSALIEFNKELNSHANLREYLIKFLKNLAITTSNSIKLQSSSLAQLTQATNQLTRKTLMIASEKCYRLSIALHLMSTRIAYEDVQTAATQLIQCGANVLSGVNGPLQQRTPVLDLDSSHATTFPDDYDTDLESECSNLNLFADGNDFSWEAIKKGRNMYYQKQLANQIKNQVNEMILLLTSTLNMHLNIGQDMTMNTSQVFMSLETRSIESLSNKQIKRVGNAQINLPSNFNTNINNSSTISIRSMMEPLASFGDSKSQSNTNVSTSISFSILNQNGNEISIETNENHSIEIIIPRDPNIIIPKMILQNVTSTNSTPHNQLFHFHHVNITSILSISVHLEIRPLNTNLSYLLVYKFDQIPRLISSINQIDGWTLLCLSNLTNESIYTHFIDNQQTSGHQSLVFGLRELNSTETINVCSNSSVKSLSIINERFNFTSNYELRIFTSGCYYLDKNNNWQSDGLRVGPLTNHYQTQCFSTHLTTFAGSYIVLPKAINWNYVFANADFIRNKTVYLTIICISIIYLILMIYARFKDKKDLEKLGVTPLLDNHKLDEYFYQIIVFTGQRKDAGTKSKVHFVLYGNDDQTHIHTFTDPHRQILQRGGIDAFIMAVPKSLGLLNCIRIWHDNTGQGSSASWFLKYLIIRDLQTMEKFRFISQQWFAVEKDDGKIERTLPVAGEIEKNKFSHILSKQTYHSVSDGHLWFSIFSRPASNKFTRVQRCTCCFVLLFLSMFLNIMYYNLKKETNINNSTSLSVGSLQITPEQIGIGVIVELLALIPSLLIVQLFRRIRSRQKQISPLRQTLYKIKSSLKIQENVVDNKNKSKVKSPKTFPWWFIFIIYGLCLILVGISIIFIIARGIEFGDIKTEQWLTSILLTQPIKIICLGIFFAFFCRKSDDDNEANEYLMEDKIELYDDEEYLHLTKNKPLFVYRAPVGSNRLNKAEVVCARDQQLKENHMWSIIREILINLCFLSLLFVITYSNQNSYSFLQVNHLQKYFHNSRQVHLDYTKISTINQYWKLFENIRAQQWYNDENPRNLNVFINDKSNRLIDWVTMRQLRIKLNLTCQYDYNLSNEEKNSFEIGWKNKTTIKFNSIIQKAFQYKSSDELDTYVYIGNHGSYNSGGYVYEFRGLKKLTELEVHDERDAQMHSQYVDPIENFSNKIDQLLDALNRIYMDQRTNRI